MIEAPFHPAYYVDTEGCGSYEGLSDEQPASGSASERDQAIIQAELDNMFRADLYQKFELNLISATDELPPLVPIIKRKGVLMCSEGNISAVVGEAKSKKTFLCTALVGSMLDVCKQLKEKGAKRIFVFATFGLFCNGLEHIDAHRSVIGHLRKMLLVVIYQALQQGFVSPYALQQLLLALHIVVAVSSALSSMKHRIS